MSHCIETMFSVREKPWHYEMTKDVTKLIQEAPTSLDALRYAGLDWEVVDRPVFDTYGNEIAGYKANTRTSDDSVLGIVSDRYKIVQNREAFDFTDSLVGEALKYETAGSLRNGKQVWLLGRMPDTKILGDEVEPYICFTNTHDGSGAVRVLMTPVRVVCNNTLNFALESAKRSWSARHTGDITSKLADARETLMLANDYMKAMNQTAEEMATQPLSATATKNIINALVPVMPDATPKQKEQAAKQKEEIMVCMFAPDLANFAGTKWGFLNAIADYCDHALPQRMVKGYDERKWGKIMTGHPMLDKAFAMAAEAV